MERLSEGLESLRGYSRPMIRFEFVVPRRCHDYLAISRDVPEHSTFDGLAPGRKRRVPGQRGDPDETDCIRGLVDADEDTESLTPDDLAGYLAADRQGFHRRSPSALYSWPQLITLRPEVLIHRPSIPVLYYGCDRTKCPECVCPTPWDSSNLFVPRASRPASAGECRAGIEVCEFNTARCENSTRWSRRSWPRLPVAPTAFPT